MMRSLVSLKWEEVLRSSIVAAFESYGAALLAIAPSEPPSPAHAALPGKRG